jgi:small acid-soluble spore protein F (minor alpha/beta-type SASP)
VRASVAGVFYLPLLIAIKLELFFYDVVEREGWGGIKARDAGNMVKRAIEMAEQGVARENNKL